MGIKEIATTIINTGSTVVLLAYFIYKDNKFTETINKALTSINESLEIIRNKLL